MASAFQTCFNFSSRSGLRILVLFLAVSTCVHMSVAQGVQQESTCMTRALRNAGIHSFDIQRVSASLAKSGIGERILANLEYGTLEQTLKEGGLPSWLDRRKIFKCFNTNQQRKLNTPCASRICQNGGMCNFDAEATSFFCQCTSNYFGDSCQTRLSDQDRTSHLEQELGELRTLVQSAGVTYTRWGHNACPRSALLVYSGFMAGAHYTNTGNGGNRLCLPFNPQYVPNIGHPHTSIHGAEYQSLNEQNSRGTELENRRVSCAVCDVASHSRVLMVPARMDCPARWTREYYGFIVSAKYDHQKGDYVCVDREMRALPGPSDLNQTGGRIYPVGASCNHKMECPPYQEHKPITCSVCTK